MNLSNQLLLNIEYDENNGGIMSYSPISVNKATFKDGFRERIHRWFRLTPSFGPSLVEEMLNKLEYQKGEVVLDPFGGAGTTMIDCQLNGIKSYGFEINPLLHFVGETCLEFDIQSEELQKNLEDIEKKFTKLNNEVTFANLSNYSIKIPNIHNPHRWWNEEVLKELLVLKKVIYEITELNPKTRNFFLLAIAGVLVPDLTNVTLGKLQLHFIDRSKEEIKVLPIFTRHANNMIEDIIEMEKSNSKRSSKIFLTDSTVDNSKLFSEKINCVVTSPPYPNRYSYVWNTRPHLYFLDFFDSPKQASNLDLSTIGGTWGSATSSLMKGVVRSIYPVVNDILDTVVSKIRESDNLMANYVMKYFNLISKQIMEMDKLMADNGRLAYVVGNSNIKGVYVETDMLLSQIIEGLDLRYKIKEINRFRKRHSGVNLYESIVYAWKN